MLKLKNAYLLFIPLAFLALQSCKKDKRWLNNDVQPASDMVSASFDSSAVLLCHTKKFDSIISYNTKYKFLGCNQDPYFGKTTVGLYLNANMSVSNLTFGTSPQLSRAEIILALDAIDYAGDKNAALTYSVFTLDSSLNYNRNYYTSKKNLHTTQVLSASSSTFEILNGAPVIRIKVDSAFASALINSPQNLTDNAKFQSVYKGFYIACANQQDSEGVIFRCNLEDERSGFFVYYKPTPADTVSSFRFTFSGSSAARFNTVAYDYSQAHSSLYSQLNGDTLISPAQNIFLKGMGTTKVKVWIQGLRNYSDSFNVAVNRAELIFNIDQSFSAGGTYNYPAKLTLLPLDSTGRETFAIDQLNSIDAARYDGNYDAANKRYVFNLARHIQAILSGTKRNYGFYLLITDPNATYTPFRDAYIDRLVLHGSGKGALRPRFNLSYVKFKNN